MTAAPLRGLVALRWIVAGGYLGVAFSDAYTLVGAETFTLTRLGVSATLAILAIGLLLGLRSVVGLCLVACPALVLAMAFGLEVPGTTIAWITASVEATREGGPWWAWVAGPAAVIVHTALLLPGLMSNGHAAARGALPGLGGLSRRLRFTRPPLHLPDGVDVYERHPFRVLGLRPSDAVPRSIFRRRDELLAVLEAGLPVREHVEGFVSVDWSWSRPVTPADLNRAAGRLQSEPSRLAEEVCWFRLDDARDGVSAGLAAGDVPGLRQVWERCRARLDSASDAAAALHNLAVLHHAEVLHHERAAAQAGKVGGRQRARWQRSLQLWTDVHDTDACWEHFEGRLSGSSDPRVARSSVADLRAQLAVRLLSIHAEIARAAIVQGHPAYARCHLDLVRKAAFPQAAKDQALNALFHPYREELRQALAPLLRAENKLTTDIDFGAARKAVRRLRRRLGKLDGEAGLGLTAGELVRQLRPQISRELDAALNPLYDVLGSVFARSNELIGFWNGTNAWDRDRCRLIRQYFKENGDRLAQVDSQLVAIKSTARLAVKALRVLAAACVPGTEDVAKQIAAEMKRARACGSKAGTDIGKVRGHYQRNYTVMASRA